MHHAAELPIQVVIPQGAGAIVANHYDVTMWSRYVDLAERQFVPVPVADYHLRALPHDDAFRSADLEVVSPGIFIEGNLIVTGDLTLPKGAWGRGSVSDAEVPREAWKQYCNDWDTYENYDAALKVASWSIDGALDEGACYRIVVAGTLNISDGTATLGADHIEYFSTLSDCD